MTSIGVNMGNGPFQPISDEKGPLNSEPKSEMIPPQPGTSEYLALFPNSGVFEIQDMNSIQPNPHKQLWV